MKPARDRYVETSSSCSPGGSRTQQYLVCIFNLIIVLARVSRIGILVSSSEWEIQDKTTKPSCNYNYARKHHYFVFLFSLREKMGSHFRYILIIIDLLAVWEVQKLQLPSIDCRCTFNVNYYIDCNWTWFRDATAAVLHKRQPSKYVY